MPDSLRSTDPEVHALTVQILGLVTEAERLASDIDETVVTLDSYKQARASRRKRRRRTVHGMSEG